MSNANLGNILNGIVDATQATLFDQGELAQLTYGAFDIAARSMQESNNETIEVTFPVGWRSDNQAINSTRTYKKEQLLGRYQLLAFNHLAINGLVQLVTTTEAMLGDVVRAVVTRYPQKLGAKRSIPLQVVLESTSMEEIHLRATDALLNELSYKSPNEFAELVQPLLSINLLECPAFHRYMEIKASRDIFIHNRGVANEFYVKKAGSHGRVKSGVPLPADILYFLNSYETCLQLTEWMADKLHEQWHSSDHESRKKMQNKPHVAQDAAADVDPAAASG